jgi:hypothetical protein
MVKVTAVIDACHAMLADSICFKAMQSWSLAGAELLIQRLVNMVLA